MAASEEHDFDPTQNATVKLLTHITEKGFQLGSCIGSVLVVPVTAYRGRGSNYPLVPKLLRGLSRSAVITTAVSGVRSILRDRGFVSLVRCMKYHRLHARHLLGHRFAWAGNGIWHPFDT